MKHSANKKRHRPEGLVAKLRQAHEAMAKDMPIAEVVRALGVADVPCDRWRAEHGRWIGRT